VNDKELSDKYRQIAVELDAALRTALGLTALIDGSEAYEAEVFDKGIRGGVEAIRVIASKAITEHGDRI